MNVPAWLPILLGFLAAVGPVSTDMYLPAFPAIEASLGGTPGTAQITLATWFVGLAFGQIMQGPLSDRFGRRRPLIVGTALYTVASTGCALAGGLHWLAVWRFLAAIGGSASMVISRAVVRDLSDGHAAVRMLSRLTLIMGVAPILAPTLGGIVLARFSWHAIFWICTAYGFVCCALVWRLLPDTLPRQQRVRLSVAAQFARYAIIVRERGFLTHALMAGCGLFGMFGFLAGSPPVFIQQFNFSPPQYGILFGSCAAGYVIASQINPRMVQRFGGSRVLRVASRMFLVATVALAVVSITGAGGWPAVALPILISMTCQGFNLPNATVGSLSRHAAHAGSASALLGTMQFCLGAVSGLLAGALQDGTARPMAALMLLGATGVAMADLFRPRTP